MPYRTTPRMAERKRQVERRILDAATGLFGDRGYHATTVPMVVEASGTSTGSFYFYFRNKEHLFAEVLRALGERLAESLNEAIGAHDSAAAQMPAAIRGLFVYLTTHPTEGRILLIETSGLGGDIERIRQDIVASHARSVQHAIETLGGPLDDDARILARCWVGAVYEAARWWLELPTGDRPPPIEIAECVADFNLRGVGLNIAH
jgi:AcrR family transcriptional regulator